MVVSALEGKEGRTDLVEPQEGSYDSPVGIWRWRLQACWHTAHSAHSVPPQQLVLPLISAMVTHPETPHPLLLHEALKQRESREAAWRFGPVSAGERREGWDGPRDSEGVVRDACAAG